MFRILYFTSRRSCNAYKFLNFTKSWWFNFYKYSFYSSDASSNFSIRILPALVDNYMYVIIDRLSKIALAVDPVEPDKILQCIEQENLSLKAILTTHHHLDHSGGNKALCSAVKDIHVYGGDDRIDCLTNKLNHNEKFVLGNMNITCLHTPCHTSGHVCYFVQMPHNVPVCFSGDTLFISGCGRFFEGSAEHMLKSLNILASLPGSTKIYCGHEYTINNLKFALHVEPNNAATKHKLLMSEKKLEMSEPTVPSTIQEELSYNPFLRTSEKSVQEFTNEKDPTSVMKVLRERKDNF